MVKARGSWSRHKRERRHPDADRQHRSIHGPLRAILLNVSSARRPLATVASEAEREKASEELGYQGHGAVLIKRRKRSNITTFKMGVALYAAIWELSGARGCRTPRSAA